MAKSVVESSDASLIAELERWPASVPRPLYVIAPVVVTLPLLAVALLVCVTTSTVTGYVALALTLVLGVISLFAIFSALRYVRYREMYIHETVVAAGRLANEVRITALVLENESSQDRGRRLIINSQAVLGKIAIELGQAGARDAAAFVNGLADRLGVALVR